MKITLDSLPILIGAALLGPLDGLAVGLVGSFLNQMITYGFTVTTLLWILPAGLRGLFVGLYARKRSFSMTTPQTVFITVLTALFVTALNTLLLYVDSWVYSYSYAAALPTLRDHGCGVFPHPSPAAQDASPSVFLRVPDGN